MKWKKWVPALWVLTVLIGALGMFISPVSAEESLPSRAIYVIYDDSGSMYIDDRDPSVMVDTWSKAKYSMEVFASMLGSKDTMDIYYMSDYSKDGSRNGARIEISGADLPSSNVQKIHDERTSSGTTPFETVEAAYEDLEKSSADEKWLVVLTDGDFQKDGVPNSDKSKVTQFMDDFFSKKDEDVSVAFLAMGDDVVPITENRSENIYFEQAQDSSQILQKVTDISNRIFNTNRLNAASDTGKFTLDVPMSQITVFVQGKGAEIEGLKDASGKAAGIMKPAVSVSATETSDNDAHKNNPPDASLQGETAVFEGTFPPGEYQVEAKNASKIEIYYKPDLAVSAYLTTASGEKITDLRELPTGDYGLHFELVSGIDGSALPQKNVVSQSESGVEYEAVVSNNGKSLGGVYQDGDTIHVEQGNLDIDVTASFLKYNTVHTRLNYDVWSSKAVTFAPVNEDSWTLKGTMQADQPLEVQMLVEGAVPSEQEWEQVNVPAVSTVGTEERLLDAPVIEKSQTPGIFYITPNSEQKDFTHKPYTKDSFQLSMDQDVDSIPWRGEGTMSVQIRDDRPFWVKHGDWIASNWWLFVILLVLIALGIGYIPGVKKYLPKAKKKPNISCDPKNRRVKPKNEPGLFKADAKSTWIPYIPQKATLRFVPKNSDDISERRMELEAKTNRGTMLLKNAKGFKTSAAEINGRRIADEGTKPVLLSLSSLITVNGTDYSYTCRLNEAYKRTE